METISESIRVAALTRMAEGRFGNLVKAVDAGTRTAIVALVSRLVTP